MSEKVSEKAIEIAACVWCEPETSRIVMNTELAMAFAKVIDKYLSRIAELESQVNQLIEAGFDLSSYVPFECPEVQRFYRVMKECKPEVKE